jgi:SAM-dependent methyltransferase
MAMGKSSGKTARQPYFLPQSGEREIDRLDVQHYALALAVGGHYLAPVRQPRRVLDVGCGTGRWCMDVSAGLPDAEVVGFDLTESKVKRAPNYQFVKGDVLRGLPFEDESFGFVHQRLLVVAVPLADWPRVVADIVRVTEPGGWVELAETAPFLSGAGPATERLVTMWWNLGQKSGFDTAGHLVAHLDQYLRDAGLVNVSARTVLVPVGDWADQIGRMMRQDMRSLITQTAPRMAMVYNITLSEVNGIVQAAMDELETRHPYFNLRVAWGKRRLIG